MTPRVLERAIITIIPLLLLITTTPALIKATNQNQTGYLPAVNQTVFPGFSTYSNAHFSLKYPSSWSVNNTSENQTTFLQNNIPHKGPRVDIRWTSQLAPPSQ